MHNDELIETVDIVRLISRVKIHIQGSIRDFRDGDEIIVGPTPLSKLRMTGTIDGKNDTDSILIL